MHKYFVTQNKHITPTTLLLSLKKRSNTKPFLFQPGQYAAISFKHHHRPTTTRCFSIVSSPTEMDILQFSARSNGRFTKALNDLTVGDEVTVRGSFGAFVFDPARDKDAVLIAGGITRVVESTSPS
ncbi:MAG: FAD-dependent oxidoreductase [Candidatus Saccharibacteria bacterium]